MDNRTISDYVAGIVTSASKILEYFSYFAFVLVICFWFYAGYSIYSDSRKRYAFSNEIYYYIILFVGIITGFLGLVVYFIIRPKYTFDEIEFMQTEYKYYFSNSVKVSECLKCGSYMSEGSLYCTNCGYQNRFKCKKCGNITNYYDNYCNVCGIDLKERNAKFIEKVSADQQGTSTKTKTKEKSNKKSKKEILSEVKDKVKLNNPKYLFENAKAVFLGSVNKIKSKTAAFGKPKK